MANKQTLAAIKLTRPRFVAPSQMHKSKRPQLLKKALLKAERE